MLNRPPSSAMDMELAKARQLMASGRRDEAMAMALTLLRQALGQLRHHLLSLQDNLARVKRTQHRLSSQSEEGPGDYPVRPPSGGRYYH